MQILDKDEKAEIIKATLPVAGEACKVIFNLFQA